MSESVKQQSVDIVATPPSVHGTQASLNTINTTNGGDGSPSLQRLALPPPPARIRRPSAPLPFVTAHPPTAQQTLDSVDSSSSRDLVPDNLPAMQERNNNYNTVSQSSSRISLRRLESFEDNYNMPSASWRLAKETEYCINWINDTIRPDKDADLVHLCPDRKPFPTEPADKCGPLLFKACQDGWIIAKMLNFIEPDVIDCKPMKKASTLMFHHLENCQRVMTACKTVGIQLSNFAAENIAKGQSNVILSIIVQIIKIANWQTENIFTSIGNGPNDERTIETLLVEWVASKLKSSPSASNYAELSSIPKDFREPLIYADLFIQLMPETFAKKEQMQKLQAKVKNERKIALQIEALAEMAALLGFRWFLSESDILRGREMRISLYLVHLYSRMSLAHDPVRRFTITGSSTTPAMKRTSIVEHAVSNSNSASHGFNSSASNYSLNGQSAAAHVPSPSTPVPAAQVKQTPTGRGYRSATISFYGEHKTGSGESPTNSVTNSPQTTKRPDSFIGSSQSQPQPQQQQHAQPPVVNVAHQSTVSLGYGTSMSRLQAGDVDEKVGKVRRKMEELEGQTRTLLEVNDELRRQYESREERLRTEYMEKQGQLHRELEVYRMESAKFLETRDVLENRIRSLEAELRSQTNSQTKRLDDQRLVAQDKFKKEQEQREELMQKEFDLREIQIKTAYEERERLIRREAEERIQRAKQDMEKFDKEYKAEFTRRDSVVKQLSEDKDAVFKREVEQREQTIKLKNEEIEQCKKRIAELEGDIKRRGMEKEYLVEHEDDLVKKIDDLQLDIRFRQQRIEEQGDAYDKLVHDHKALSKKLDETTNELAAANEELDRQREVILSLESEVERVETSYGKYFDEKTAMESEVREARRNVELLTNELILCRSLLENERDRNNTIDSSGKSVLQVQHDQQIKINQLTAELATKNKEIMALTVQAEIRAKDALDSRSTAGKAEEKLSILSEKLQSTAHDLFEAERKLEDNKLEISRLTNTLQQYKIRTETDLAKNLQLNSDLLSEKQQFKSEIARLTNECEKLKEIKQTLSAKVDTLEDQLSTAKTQLNIVTKEYSDQKSQSDSVTQAKQNLERDFQAYESKIRELEDLVQLKDKELLEYRRLLGELKNAESAKTSILRSLEDKDKRVEELEETVRMKQAEISELEKLFSKLTADLNATETAKASLERKLEHRNRELHQKIDQLNEYLLDRQNNEQEVMDLTMEKSILEKTIMDALKKIDHALRISASSSHNLGDIGRTASEANTLAATNAKLGSIFNVQVNRIVRVLAQLQEELNDEKENSSNLNQELQGIYSRKLEPLKREYASLLVKERELTEQVIPGLERSIQDMETELRRKRDQIAKLQAVEKRFDSDKETFKLIEAERDKALTIEIPLLKDRLAQAEHQLRLKTTEVQKWKEANTLLREKIKGVAPSSEKEASKILSEKAMQISQSTKQFKEAMYQRAHSRHSNAFSGDAAKPMNEPGISHSQSMSDNDLNPTHHQ